MNLLKTGGPLEKKQLCTCFLKEDMLSENMCKAVIFFSETCILTSVFSSLHSSSCLLFFVYCYISWSTNYCRSVKEHKTGSPNMNCAACKLAHVHVCSCSKKIQTNCEPTFQIIAEDLTCGPKLHRVPLSMLAAKWTTSLGHSIQLFSMTPPSSSRCPILHPEHVKTNCQHSIL